MSDGSHAISLVNHELKYIDKRFSHVARADPSRITVKQKKQTYVIALSFRSAVSGAGKPCKDILSWGGS